MKTLKRILVMILTIFFGMTFIACDNSSKQTANNTVEVTVDPIISAKDGLGQAYSLCIAIEADFVQISGDRSSLVIDGNSKYSSDVVVQMLKVTNSCLDLPDSLIDRIIRTRAIDGIQSQPYGKYTITWSFHPDYGLQVIYEVNQ